MSAVKEMNIVFVYDRERCSTEEDDPISAVSYFHPSWVSDVHRLTLCGQLMGVAQFLNLNFNEARMIVLQSGKFILTPFGRFILVVGTDRNISDAALTYRSDLLTNVVRLYHKNLETVYEQCMGNSVNYKTVTDKFYHIFETYLPLLQHQSSVFNSFPVLKMSASASCVFVEAMQTLRDCGQQQGVIGGTILYHNKIVSTQLPPQMAKLLVLTDPYRIKTTAAPVSVPYHIPVGVQLAVVYIPRRDFQKLLNDSQRARNVQNSTDRNGENLPFQIKRKTKAREKQSVFWNIPEEEPVNETMGEQSNGVAGRPRNGVTKARPTHLPLSFKNQTTKDVPDSGVTSINFDETDSYPQFHGKTTVLPTPILENKILPGNLVAICANKVIHEQQQQQLKEAQEEEDRKKAKNGRIDLKKVEEKIFAQLQNDQFRRNTLKDTLIKYPSLRGIHGLFTSKNGLDRSNGKPKYQTITDPSYPVFNEDGQPISNHMYEMCGIEVGVDIAQDVESLTIEGFPMTSDSMDDEQLMEKPQNGSVHQVKDAVPEEKEGEEEIVAINEIVFRNKSKDPAINSKRLSLTLPIQPINLSDGQSTTDDAIGSGSGGSGEETDNNKPVKRNRMDFPVTPIMSKIIAQLPHDAAWTIPAMTPVITPTIGNGKLPMARKPSISKVDELNEEEEEEGGDTGESSDLQKVELFVCGQHNMTMLIAMEENSGQSEELVKLLWERSISRLPKIESNLQQTLNVNVDGVVDKNDMNYSFMCFDPNWDVTQQGGHWTASELQAVEEIHADFIENGSFTETLVRCNDAVIYGYRCGDSEVYYKQPTSQLRGIPQPGDGMGNAPKDAKIRLERDHSINLL